MREQRLMHLSQKMNHSKSGSNSTQQHLPRESKSNSLHQLGHTVEEYRASKGLAVWSTFRQTSLQVCA
jgi:hypothetical protein